MTLVTANINSLWASLVIGELVRHGITQYVLSPGSRSTPLVVGIANDQRTRSVVHFDERGAAFCALGFARATGKPVALVCTSGTAVANYLPAVIEASVDNIPLILLTADRPAELRDSGANQTITQPGIFSHYVRWEIDFPCPNTCVPAEFVLTSVDQAVHRALSSPAGPVHLNFQFREPLAPVDVKGSFSGYMHSIESWLTAEEPFTTYQQPQSILSADFLSNMTDRVSKAARGLMVIGYLRTDTERRAVAALSERLGWPLFADITSGLRGGEIRTRIEYFDAILASPRFITEHCPDMILQIGARLTSRRLLEYLQLARAPRYLLVTHTPQCLDPVHRVTEHITCEPADFCTLLTERIAVSTPTPWYGEWRLASQQVDAHFEASFAALTELNEPLLARAISTELAPDSTLFLASSMPIRDLDQFSDPRAPWLPVAANRGASGIDGTVATAAGYALGSEKPVVLFIGDLALLHDLNSLALLHTPGIKLTIVILNNHGGAIFGYLPIAGFENLFEKYFLTPHTYTFDSIARQFDLPYSKAESLQAFVEQYRAAQISARCTIIEVPITRETNQKFHSDLLGEIVKKLEKD